MPPFLLYCTPFCRWVTTAHYVHPDSNGAKEYPEWNEHENNNQVKSCVCFPSALSSDPRPSGPAHSMKKMGGFFPYCNSFLSFISQHSVCTLQYLHILTNNDSTHCYHSTFHLFIVTSLMALLLGAILTQFIFHLCSIPMIRPSASTLTHIILRILAHYFKTASTLTHITPRILAHYFKTVEYYQFITSFSTRQELCISNYSIIAFLTSSLIPAFELTTTELSLQIRTIFYCRKFTLITVK